MCGTCGMVYHPDLVILDPNMDFSKLEFDVTTISSGLKAFFKLLPDPLISENIAQEILKALGRYF